MSNAGGLGVDGFCIFEAYQDVYQPVNIIFSISTEQHWKKINEIEWCSFCSLQKINFNWEVKMRTVLFTTFIALLYNFCYGGTYNGGTGTEVDPYQIATKQDLLELAANTSDYDKHFIMTADIDLSGESFHAAVIAPDMDVANDFQGTAFRGIFNGNNHIISNLAVTGESYCGLFGYIDECGANHNCGTVKNLGLHNISIEGSGRYIGGLAGCNTAGTTAAGGIINCYSIGSVTGGDGAWYVGGVVGINVGSISDCYSAGSVTGGDGVSLFGGLVGGNDYGIISNCYSSSSVMGEANSYYLGGLIGKNSSGTISNSHSIGPVIGDDYLGGLTGANSCSFAGNGIVDCYSHSPVTGRNGSRILGGLCGENNDHISNSYSSGSISSGNSSEFVGGLCGLSYSAIFSNCYSTSRVAGGDSSSGFGGFCGVIQYSTISNCYSKGEVTTGDLSESTGGLCGSNFRSTIDTCYSSSLVNGGNYIGGLCGNNYQGSFYHSFWDTETSGQASSAGGTGKTTLEMQTISTFTDAGWDFAGESLNGQEDVWVMGASGYPDLTWHATQCDLGHLNIWSAQAYSEQDGALSTALRITDKLQGLVSGANVTVVMKNSAGEELDSGVLVYSDGSGYWNYSKAFAGGLAPGRYELQYAVMTNHGRWGTETAFVWVPGMNVAIEAKVTDASSLLPIEGATVAIFNSLAFWNHVNGHFNGSVPELSDLLSSGLVPLRGPNLSGSTGILQWSDLPAGGSCVIVAAKDSYFEKMSESFVVPALDTVILKELSLVGIGSTISNVADAVQSVQNCSEMILEQNANLAGQISEQWREDDFYNDDPDWFAIGADVLGSTAGSVINPVSGTVRVGEKLFKECLKNTLTTMIKQLSVGVFEHNITWLENNSFPENKSDFMASQAHTIFADQILQKRQGFDSEASLTAISSNFSYTNNNALIGQISSQRWNIIDSINPFIMSPDFNGPVYDFTLNNDLSEYKQMSKVLSDSKKAVRVLSTIHAAGGSIALYSSSANLPLAIGAYLIGETAGMWADGITISDILLKDDMAKKFCIAMSFTYPENNSNAVGLFNDYINFIIDEAQNPYYLHQDNTFNASTSINMNFVGGDEYPVIWKSATASGSEWADGFATVTVTNESSVSSNSTNPTIRCMGYSTWGHMPGLRDHGIGEKMKLILATSRGPNNLPENGSLDFMFPYAGFTRDVYNKTKPHYFIVSTYIGPFWIGDTYEPFFVLPFGQRYTDFKRNNLYQESFLTKSTSTTYFDAIVNRDGPVPTQLLTQSLNNNQVLINAHLSASEPNILIEITSDPNLYAMDFRLFVPQHVKVSFLLENAQGYKVGYNTQDGISYKELMADVTDMSERPISLRHHLPDPYKTYKIKISLLSPGPRDIPMKLFYEPVFLSDATMTVYPSVPMIDGHINSSQKLTVNIGEESGQHPLTSVNASLGNLQQWNGNGFLSIASDPNVWLGDIPAGESLSTEWKIDYTAQTSCGKYVGFADITSNETSSFEIPVVALLRYSSEIVSMFEGPDPNVAVSQKKIQIDGSDDPQTWVYVPVGYHVVHASMGIACNSANVYDPQIDIGADGTIEWSFNGHLDMGVMINNIEDAYNHYISSHIHNEDGINIPILVEVSSGTSVSLSGLQLYLDRIPSDFEPDGDVDLLDLGKLCFHWLEDGCNEPNWCSGTDMDFDGNVNFTDFSLFSDYWLYNNNFAIEDINKDNIINFQDFLILASAWLSVPYDTNWNPACDLNEPADNIIDIRDFQVLAENWLK